MEDLQEEVGRMRILSMVVTLLLMALISSSAMAAKKNTNSGSTKDKTPYACFPDRHADGKLQCWCKVGTGSCTDMSKEACRDVMICSKGTCSCIAKDTFIKTSPRPRRPKSIGSGYVVAQETVGERAALAE